MVTNNSLLDINRIAFKTFQGYIFVNYEDIIRIEADHNNSLLFKVNETNPIKLAGNIAKLESVLEKIDYFFKCHRCHIINVFHLVHFFEKDRILTTTNGNIPISKNKIKEFKEVYCFY